MSITPQDAGVIEGNLYAVLQSWVLAQMTNTRYAWTIRVTLYRGKIEHHNIYERVRVYVKGERNKKGTPVNDSGATEKNDSA